MSKSTVKKSFLLYKDSLSILDKLSDDQAGKLFKSIKKYQDDGEIMQLDFALEIAFDPFLNQFKRDEQGYEKTCEANRLAALSRWNKDKQPNTSACDRIQVDAKDADSDKDSDSEKDKIKKEKELTKSQFELFWDKYNHKKSRPLAEKSFAKSLKSESFEKIMLGVDSYIKSRSPESKFWKHPATWLNQECWNDESTTESNQDICQDINQIIGENLIIKIDKNGEAAKLYFNNKDDFDKMSKHPKKEEIKTLINKTLSTNKFEFNY